ncbi:MAG: MBL fold metallo-hydrolase [Candidatus Aenigmatarchaeota archaeon]
MTSMEITFLGTGAAIPTLERAHPAIHLRYSGKSQKSILFDCGEGTQTQLLRAKINFMGVGYVFVTHWHADHFIGLYGLLNSMGLEGRQETVRIFGPEADTLGPELFKFYNFPFDIEFFDTYRDGVVYEEDEFMVEALVTKHTIRSVAYAFVEKGRVKLNMAKVKKLGLDWKACRALKERGWTRKEGKKITLKSVSNITPERKIVYSGDTVYVPKMKRFAKGAEILIHECTCLTKDDVEGKMHSCLDDIMKLKDSAKKVYLIHIGRKYQHHEDLLGTVNGLKNVAISRDMERVKI